MKKIEEAAVQYRPDEVRGMSIEDEFSASDLEYAFKAGAQWQQTNQWISVKDELPENDCEVLAHIEHNDKEALASVLYFSKTKNQFYMFDINKGPRLSVSNVTHWMPIPKLPTK